MCLNWYIWAICNIQIRLTIAHDYDHRPKFEYDASNVVVRETSTINSHYRWVQTHQNKTIIQCKCSFVLHAVLLSAMRCVAKSRHHHMWLDCCNATTTNHIIMPRLIAHIGHGWIEEDSWIPPSMPHNQKLAHTHTWSRIKFHPISISLNESGGVVIARTRKRLESAYSCPKTGAQIKWFNYRLHTFIQRQILFICKKSIAAQPMTFARSAWWGDVAEREAVIDGGRRVTYA